MGPLLCFSLEYVRLCGDLHRGKKAQVGGNSVHLYRKLSVFSRNFYLTQVNGVLSPRANFQAAHLII